MNTKSLLICIALLVAFSLATAQRNENMFSPAGCPPNSRPVENAPKNQASCGDTQQAQEEKPKKETKETKILVKEKNVSNVSVSKDTSGMRTDQGVWSLQNANSTTHRVKDSGRLITSN
uniref:Uncharacterized protein n=1 Tax=Phlebotomus papatasi TaxID=29031 RepID=A0A1B0D8Q8_PHLPP